MSMRIIIAASLFWAIMFHAYLITMPHIPNDIPVMTIRYNVKPEDAARFVQAYGVQMNPDNFKRVGDRLRSECSKYTKAELPKHKREIEMEISIKEGVDCALSFDSGRI